MPSSVWCHSWILQIFGTAGFGRLSKLRYQLPIQCTTHSRALSLCRSWICTWLQQQTRIPHANAKQCHHRHETKHHQTAGGVAKIIIIIIICICSGGFYSRNEGKTWILAMLLTATFFPLTSFAICSILNSIAIAYHSLAAVPFTHILLVVFVFLGISCPLCLFGTVSPLAPWAPCHTYRMMYE